MRVEDAQAVVAMVIPCLDEQAAVCGTVSALPKAGLDAGVVVDDGSRDATVARAGAAGARADATVLAVVDGDGSDRVELAGEVVGPVLAGSADVVVGFRFRGSHEPGRRPAASARHRSRAGAQPAHLRDAGRRPVPGRRRVRDVGSDMGRMAPMSGARATAYGTRPGEHVADGGCAEFPDLAGWYVTASVPLPKPRDPARDRFCSGGPQTGIQPFNDPKFLSSIMNFQGEHRSCRL